MPLTLIMSIYSKEFHGTQAVECLKLWVLWPHCGHLHISLSEALVTLWSASVGKKTSYRALPSLPLQFSHRIEMVCQCVSMCPNSPSPPEFFFFFNNGAFKTLVVGKFSGGEKRKLSTISSKSCASESGELRDELSLGNPLLFYHKAIS